MKVNIIKQGFITFSFAVISVGLLSCGGDGRKPLDASSASLVLTQFKTQLAGIPTSNTTPTMVSGLTGVSFGALSTHAVSCYNVTPIPAVDADGDGIAATKTYTIDCSNETSGEQTFTQKGTLVFKDLDESVKGVYGGMRAEYNMPTFSTTGKDGLEFNYSHVGFWEYKNDGSALKSTSEYTGGVKYAYHGFNMDYKYSQKWNYTMTPDVNTAADAYKKGKIEISGSFGMTGDFVVEDRDGKHNPFSGTWVISYVGVDLIYDSTCSNFYRSGSHVISDTMNKIEIRYECTSSKLYVNGVLSDWWKG